ncbi:MAG: hypothetical protein MJY71_02385 [Bacteroidaceae bacterium]|nr:hypothetical protein [Bacteroidaceae bacterium]
MAIKIGTQDMVARYIGSQEIGKVYIGSDLVWEKYEPDYLKIEKENNPISITLRKVGTPPNVSIEYSYDKKTWNAYNIGTTLYNVSTVFFRGNGNTTLAIDKSNYLNFKITTSWGNGVKISGNVMTLLDYQQEVTMGSYAFSYLFSGMETLVTAPKLPATTLSPHCYDNMFTRCSSLWSAPQLPATTLTSYCYASMFSSCTSLHEVTINADTNVNSTNLSYWLSGVGSGGTIKCKSGVSFPSGASGIPSGWTRVDI